MVQRRVGTATLQMAEQYPNKAIQVSYVVVPRNRAPLEECTRLSAHEIVAWRVDCTKSLQVCGKKKTVACLAGNRVRAVASERRVGLSATAQRTSPPTC